MESVTVGEGRGVEYARYGDGDPVTVFGHGLAAGIDETRPLGSAVAGTKVFLHFRGHGGSDPPRPAGWSYRALAMDLRAVADAVAATRAVGVSMGAGALLALLAATPDRFERCVFYLPGALDAPRTGAAVARLSALAAAVAAGDVAGIAAHLAAELPPDVRMASGVPAYLRKRARALTGTAVADALRALPAEVPLTDTAVLRRVSAPSLVVGEADDDVHPVEVARELADALPDARLVVFDEPGTLWRRRGEVRRLVSEFLNAA
ncbi:MAG: alpha/beta hydrolase [Frankia sp.]|nr:alpha/beta hydrolase [Frankia sp.]